MKTKQIISLFATIIIFNLQPLLGQYVADFNSDYDWNTSKPHLPECWVMWNGMDPRDASATPAPYEGARYVGQSSGQSKVQIFTAFFEATTADTFSFYYGLRRGSGATQSLSNFQPVVGYYRFGDPNGPVDDLIPMDTITTAAGNTWYHYEAHFQYNGLQRIVIYADESSTHGSEWVNDSETGFIFDYFTSNATYVNDNPPKVAIKQTSGGETACNTETRTFVADSLANYSSPFSLEWFVNGSFEKNAADRNDTVFSINSLSANDTVMVILEGNTVCSETESVTTIYDTASFILPPCKEINITDVPGYEKCPNEQIDIAYNTSASGNWPSGTNIYAQIAKTKNFTSILDTIGSPGNISESGATISGSLSANLDSGKYYIGLIADDPSNTFSENLDSIFLHPEPDTASINVLSPNICDGNDAIITIQNSEPGIDYKLYNMSNYQVGSTITGNGSDIAITFDPNASAGETVKTILRASDTNTSCSVESADTLYSQFVSNPVLTGNTIKIDYGSDTILDVTVNNGTAPYNYLWSPSDSLDNPSTNTDPNPRTISIKSSFDFNVQVTDVNGCTDSETVPIKNVNTLNVTIDARSSYPETGAAWASTPDKDTIVCYGATLYLYAVVQKQNSNVTYEWTRSGSTETLSTDSVYQVTIKQNKKHVFNVEVDDGSSTQTDDITINVKKNPGLNPHAIQGGEIIQDQEKVFAGEEFNLTVDPHPTEAENASYNWSPASVLLDPASDKEPRAILNNPASFMVERQLVYNDSVSCMAYDTITINTFDFEVFVPTAFTPNGDGNNDKLCVLSNGILNDIDLQIYNRWGEQVFKATRLDQCWDGSYKGKDLHMQTFGYVLKVKDTDGGTHRFTGNITLIR